jgi:hypothetical protein
MPQPQNFVKILALAAAALALTAMPARSEDEPETRIPGDHYPGPPLWRVSKGEHELWLFGTLSAIPRDMKWSSAAVEEVIGNAQEVLSPPGVRPMLTLKPVQLVRLWRRVRELSASPDGRPLAQVLPADLYRRYSAARDRYVGRYRNLEGLRPVVVAGRVYESAVEERGLVSGRDIESQIERGARRAGVKTTDTKLHADPDVLLDHAARVPAQADLDCFVKVLATIEADEQRLVPRALAWATGDIEALRKFDYPDIRRQCLAFPGWPPALKEFLDEADDQWLASAERALAENRTAFGTLDLRDLMTSNGLLAQLRERGYAVHVP